MITTNNVDLPWYKSLCRLKECHPLLFRCSLLFVVLNNDLILFAAVTAKMLLQWAASSSAFAVPWYCGLHQQHARGHCRLAIHMCTSTSTWTTMQKYKLKLTKQKFKSAMMFSIFCLFVDYWSSILCCLIIVSSVLKHFCKAWTFPEKKYTSGGMLWPHRLLHNIRVWNHM